MPIIQVNLLEGRTVDQKRKFVTDVTEAVVKSLNVKPDTVRIIIHEMAKHQYAIAGILVSDKE